jgi:hypothetical protein
MDAKVGGTYRMLSTNFTTGKAHAFGGKYLELVPGERIRYTDRSEDPNLPGEMMTPVTLKPVSVGTELNIVQEGLPVAIPLEACYLGLAAVAQQPRSTAAAPPQRIAASRGSKQRADRGPAASWSQHHVERTGALFIAF